MTDKKFFDAIGKIDDDLLKEAEVDIDKTPLKKSKKSKKIIYSACSAAAAVIIIGAAVVLIPSDKPEIINDSSSLQTENKNVQSTENSSVQSGAAVESRKRKDDNSSSVHSSKENKTSVTVNTAETQKNQAIKTSDQKKQGTVVTQESSKPSSGKDDPVQTVKTSHDAFIPLPHSEDEGFAEFENKTVLYELVQALENAQSGEVFDILARPYTDYGFIYKGKTLNDYYCDWCEERMMPEKLGQLLKEGESLKYGTMLYEGGTPDGERWAQSLYEERIGFYGQDFLDKYIVNGEFLADKVRNDLENISIQKAEDAYNDAFEAYYQHVAGSLDTTIPCGYERNKGVILHMTADEFKRFTPDKIEAWTFRLYNASGTEFISDAE